MGPLDPAAAHDALAHPAGHLGVSFDEDAIDAILSVTGCYLYFLQEWGFHVWNAATARQQLIDKGMIWSQRHGETAFTVPMFDSFMKRQMPIYERHEPKRRLRSGQSRER